MIVPLLLAVLITAPSAASPMAGSIRGVVLNASDGNRPAGGATVVLRVQLEGQLAVAAECVADERGRFIFDEIPADPVYVYLPGANHLGVHYPGPRVTLNDKTPHASVTIHVHDAVEAPNPLILLSHHITVEAEADVLRVTERQRIDNPTAYTYVGQPTKVGGRASTFHLCIPSNFRRTTFHQEFYGRQFTLIDGRLTTDIPWPPGTRELSFSYVVERGAQDRSFRRPMDLPCNHLRIEVRTDRPDDVRGNLPRIQSAESGLVVFESRGHALQPGYLVELQLASRSIPLAEHARWLAVGALLSLVVGTSLFVAKRRGRYAPEHAVAANGVPPETA